MNSSLEETLLSIAEARQVKDDPSHDVAHIRRVLFLVKKIGERRTQFLRHFLEELEMELGEAGAL